MDFAVFVSLVLIVSLYYSLLAISIAMISLAVIAVFNWSDQTAFPLQFHPQLLKTFSLLKKYPAFPLLFVFLLIVLVSGYGGTDAQYYAERLRIKVPYILIPFSLLIIPKLGFRRFHLILYGLVAISTFAACQVGINYLLHFDEINIGIKEGRPIPTVYSHVRFSLLIALSILTGVYLFFRNVQLRYSWERTAIGIATCFLFLFIHILSVRSGLFVLYVGGGISLAIYCYKNRKWKIGVVGLIGIMTLPFIAYKTIPSFYNKVHYALYDLKMHEQGSGQNYSDSERIKSLKAGWDIFQSNKLAGVGAGELRASVHTYYSTNYEKDALVKMPHNQFLTVLAGSGILGFIVFLVVLVWPLYTLKLEQNYFVLFIILVVGLSFLFENTIENSIGVAIHTFFLSLGLNAAKEDCD